MYMNNNKKESNNCIYTIIKANYNFKFQYIGTYKGVTA